MWVNVGDAVDFSVVVAVADVVVVIADFAVAGCGWVAVVVTVAGCRLLWVEG